MNYDYYELVKDFGSLKKGAIFVHDPKDDMYGSLAQGCLKLCWTADGNCFSGLCANTVFLHFRFSTDDIFKKVQSKEYKEELKNRLDELQKEIGKIKDMI